MSKLYSYHKSGKDVLAQLHSYFQKDDVLSEIENSISNCPITERQSDFFKEVIDGYKKKLYKLSSRAMLSLIEGIIWDFAWWWNSHNGLIFDKSVALEDFRRLKFKLLNFDGNEINTEPTIGLLLRNTKFGEELYFEFVEYYCEELFKERNPALHGRVPDFGDEKKASSLLLCIKILERKIFDAFSAWFAEVCIKSYEDSKLAESFE